MDCKPPKLKHHLRSAGLAVFAVALATILWLPCLHLFFRKPLANFYSERGISPQAKALAARHVQLWTEPSLRQAELKKMRGSNAEWDFMGRSFLVWLLVNGGAVEEGTDCDHPATAPKIRKTRGAHRSQTPIGPTCRDGCMYRAYAPRIALQYRIVMGQIHKLPVVGVIH